MNRTESLTDIETQALAAIRAYLVADLVADPAVEADFSALGARARVGLKTLGLIQTVRMIDKTT